MRPFPLVAPGLSGPILPVPLWSGYGRKPAAGRFKAAFRAARRPQPPGSAGWACVLREGLLALLVRTLTPLAPAAPDPEVPACRRFFLTVPEGGPAEVGLSP